MDNPLCRICNNSNALKFDSVEEMVLGTREEFEYYQRPKCHCPQIREIAKKLGQRA